jgi:hypothetical protein
VIQQTSKKGLEPGGFLTLRGALRAVPITSRTLDDQTESAGFGFSNYQGSFCKISPDCVMSPDGILPEFILPRSAASHSGRVIAKLQNDPECSLKERVMRSFMCCPKHTSKGA